jgi:hypothetical protein
MQETPDGKYLTYLLLICNLLQVRKFSEELHFISSPKAFCQVPYLFLF